jgi:hypothetical protein
MIDHLAVTLYTDAHNWGRWGQAWSALSGRSHHLLPLAEIGSGYILTDG